MVETPPQHSFAGCCWNSLFFQKDDVSWPFDFQWILTVDGFLDSNASTVIGCISGQFRALRILDQVGRQSEKLEAQMVRLEELRASLLQNSGENPVAYFVKKKTS